MKKRSILCVCIIALAAFAAWAPNADAYQTYQSFSDTNPGPRDNCALCHPGFDYGLSISNAPSHAQHLDVLDVPNVPLNCDLCHPTADFGSIPVSTSSSVGGISCIGCHGRAENQVGGQVTGAGLRQRHTRVGIFCGGCHSDNDPATFTTVGENVLPPYYLRDDVNAKDPCLADPLDGGEDYSGNGRGLDNDGDLLYDGDDRDCQPCTSDADCDDGDTCNGDETCNLTTGQCESGIPLDCNDGVACTADSCDPATGCVNTPDDTSCDDGLFCTGAETCDPELDCQPGTPPSCDDGVACTVDVCDPTLDACENTPNDTKCPDDGLFCTGMEFCDAQSDCSTTGNPCDPATEICNEDAGTCDPVGCTNDAECGDGVFCNGIETCNLATGECQAGEPPTCDDGIDCTDDSCDATLDECVNSPNNASCDDGDACNGAEICDPESGCIPGDPPDCDDGIACTDDSCGPDTGCVNTPDDASCDDGLFCTGDEICDPAAGCVSTGDPCPGGTICNEDTATCDVVSGKVTICHIPAGKPAKARTKSVNARSVAGHLGHGDYLGPCD